MGRGTSRVTAGQGEARPADRAKRAKEHTMNTQPGTNTNPTANALVQILHNAREMYLRLEELDGLVTGERYIVILEAVERIATRNGNTLDQITALADEI